MKRLLMLIILSLFILLVGAQTFGEIGTGTMSTNLPVYALWNYAWSSSIYQAADFGGARTITKLALNQIGTTSLTMSNQKIYLKESSAAAFANNNYEDPANSGYTLVYNGALTVATGWIVIDITDFVYSGNNNLIIHWENRSGASNYSTNWYSTSCSAGSIKCSGSDTSFPAATGFTPYPVALPNLRFYYSSDNPGTPTNIAPANLATGVPINTQLSFTIGSNTTGCEVFLGLNQNSMSSIGQFSFTSGNYSVTPPNTLQATTQYFWKVVATNGTGSSTSPVWSFTTEAVVSSLPFTQGFEASFPIAGWENPNGLWIQASYPHSGNYCAKASYIHTGTAILQTPRIILPANPARLKFWWIDADYLPVRIVNHDTTFCEISNNNGQNWTVLATLSAPVQQTAYQEVEVNLASYASQSIYIRFRDITDGSFSAYGVFVDDVLIEEIPMDAFISINPGSVSFSQSCVGASTTQNVIITNQGSSPMTITGITPSGAFSATNPGVISPGQSATSIVSFSPVTAGAANGSVTYNVSGAFSGNNVVQCSGSSYAAYTTLYQNFDASAELPEHWNKILVAQSTVSSITVYNSSFDAHSGTKFIKMYNAGEDTLNAKLILVTPGVNQLSNHTLSFYTKSSWGLPTDTVILGTMTNPFDHNTFTPSRTITLTDEYQQITETFSPALTDKFIAFKHGLGGGENYAVYLDDISWEGDNNTPNPVVAVYPLEAALNTRINYTDKHLSKPLTWSNGGGNPTGFRLFFGNTPTFEIIYNQDLGNVNSFVLSSVLNYNTIYYWKIVPYNEQGNAVNCPVWNFTTMPDPTVQITQENFLNEGFENTEVGYTPLGWELENLNNDSVIWSGIANSSSSTNAHTGTKAIHMGFSFLTAHNDWLYSPPLHLQAGNTYKVEFWIKAVPFPGDPCVEKMEVKWGTMPNSSAMSGLLYNNDNIVNTSYQRFEANISPSMDGVYFVGFHAYSEPLQFVLLLDDVKVTQTGTANHDDVSAIEQDRLLKCYPNPFNPETTISFDLAKSGKTKLEVYNAKGQLVKTLLKNDIEAGSHTIKWNGKDDIGKQSASGIYFYKLTTNGKTLTKKMLLMK